MAFLPKTVTGGHMKHLENNREGKRQEGGRMWGGS